MTTYIDITPINPPKYNPNGFTTGAPTQFPDSQYNFHTLWCDLDNSDPGDGSEKRVIIYPPYSTIYKPTTIILSDEANTLVEVAADSQQAIAADVLADSDAPNTVWATVTSAAMISLASSVTAIRITNVGSGAIKARIC